MSRPQCVCNHHLFLDLLGPSSVILDLGAYLGEFSREISQRTGSRVVAVEANPFVFEKTYSSANVEKLNLAAGDCEGLVSLHLASNPLGTSIYSRHPCSGENTVEVRATTLPKLISEYCGGRVDLLKVNIEGAEIPTLQACDDTTLRAVQQITIQFHDFIPELDQAADVWRAKERLRGLGFGEILFKSPNKDVLFVNLRAGSMSRWRYLAEKSLIRSRQYIRAAQKKLTRSQSS